jgi:hypothetical protein
MIEFPGLEKAYYSDQKALKNIAHGLSNIYANKKRLSGIVYLHRFSSAGSESTDRRSLGVLRALYGSQSFQAITLVTSYWGLMDEATWTGREKRLADTGLWAEMLANGSRTARFDLTRTSAMTVVYSIAKRQKTFVLEIQRQLVDEGLNLDETSVGLHVAESARNPTASKDWECKRRRQQSTISERVERFAVKTHKRR